MISVVLSILFGLLPLAVATPVVLPVIGLALGLNAIVKQWRATPRRPRVYWLAIAGIVASAVSTVLTMIGVHLHAA